MMSRLLKMSDQRWNNVLLVKVEIYNVEQRHINVLFFNVDLNNFRQRQNNVVISNIGFQNVDQRRNNVVNMTIFKKLKRAKKKKLFQLQKNYDSFD